MGADNAVRPRSLQIPHTQFALQIPHFQSFKRYDTSLHRTVVILPENLSLGNGRFPHCQNLILLAEQGLVNPMFLLFSRCNKCARRLSKSFAECAIHVREVRVTAGSGNRIQGLISFLQHAPGFVQAGAADFLAR